MGNKLSTKRSRTQPDPNSISDKNSNLSLIWLDSLLPDSFTSDLLSVFNELQYNTSETLKIFDDETECYGYIRETSLNDKLIVIVQSGNLCN